MELLTTEENYYPYVILSGAEYGKERVKNNKTSCHSERSAAQPKNPGVAAFIISLRFAGFLGKLGMTL